MTATPHDAASLELWPFLRQRPWKRRTVLALWFAFFAAYMNVSLPMSYLPKVVRQKGAAATWVGISYALQPLAIALTQIFCERVERRIGNKAMFCMGSMVAGVTTLLCAVLNVLTDDTVTFVTLLCVFRAVGGVGEGFLDTAIINMYQDVCPEVIAQVMGMSEGVIGLGLAVGPFLGGTLYTLQGYELPMIFGGLAMIAVGAAVPYLVAKCEATAGSEATSPPAVPPPAATSPNPAARIASAHTLESMDKSVSIVSEIADDDVLSPSAEWRRAEAAQALLGDMASSPSTSGDDVRAGDASAHDANKQGTAHALNGVGAAAGIGTVNVSVGGHGAGDGSELRKATRSEKVFLWCVVLCVIAECFMFGTVGAIVPLQLHEHFELSEVAIGGITGATGLVYLVCGTKLGHYVDRWSYEGTLNASPILFGQVLNLVSCALLGPASIIRPSSRTWECVVVTMGCLLNGVAMALVCIPGMCLYSRFAPSPSVASALFNSSLNIGLGVGSIACGLVMAGPGYPTAMVMGACVAAAYLVFVAPFTPGAFRRAAADADAREAAAVEATASATVATATTAL